MKPLIFHRYLEEERGIPASLLRSERFADKIKADFRANAVFPHADQDGPCGYEIKNRNFTGFAKGGEKGLWFSAASKPDATLVIAESGIDALSYAVLHPDDHARYASTGRAMNPNQPALIRAAIEKMEQGRGAWSSSPPTTIPAGTSSRSGSRLSPPRPGGRTSP